MNETTWASEPVLGFDTETTGVSTANDRIVTAAVVLRLPGRRTEVQTWLINPGVEIPAAATAVHGISTQHAVEFGAAPVTALAEIAATLAEHLRAGIPVVAYNASFDLQLLDAELARYGLPTLPKRLGHSVAPVLDPLVLDRWQDRYRKGKRTLGDLVRHYGVATQGDLHAADVDVLTTLDVLEALARKYPALAAASLAELHQAQIEAHRAWAENFNQWRQSQGFDGPGANPNWPV
ncbi:MAG: exonuclease domain-containing protein [Promicromonosporaceae bacterium]|nr:exonuclease domain-containing protein [Promicromonosporaceae bacterium]